MADIRIKDLPLATGPTTPTGTDFLAIDGLTTRKTPISALGDVAVPIASQAEAEAGVNATKRMVPVTVKQSIASEVGVTLASATQGALADGAAQAADLGTAAYQSTTSFATSAQGVKADNALIGVSAAQFGLLPSNTAAANDTILDAIEASSAQVIFVPEGRYLSNKTMFQLLNKRYVGPGQIVMSGYAQAPERAMITTLQPIPSTNRYQIFDDGFKKAHSATYTFVGAGANPAVLPDVYTNYLEWNARVHIHDFSAGFNKDAADHALGRSGAFVDTVRMYHGGQGDLVGRNFFAEISSTRALATHFFATPAAIAENGNFGVTSGTGCAYLNHSEYIYSDNNNDIAVIDRVRNYFRENNTGALGTVWGHDYPNSAGSKAVDFAYSPSGKFKVLYDSTAADLGATKAAAAFKTGDRIYWNASSTPDSLGAKFYANNLGNSYTFHNGASVVTVVNGSPSLQVNASGITVVGETTLIGELNVSSSNPWTADTAVPTASGAFTSVSCARRYKKLGRAVNINVTLTITTNGPASSFISIPLPFNAVSTEILAAACTAGSFFPVVARTSGNSLILLNASGGYPGGDGYVINVSGTYEATV